MLTGIISSVLASIVAAIAVWMYRSARMGGLQKFVVLAPHGEQLNRKFHAYLRRQIDRAKYEIVITGEGFEYKGSDGQNLADAYHDSIRSALDREVDITRFQTSRPLHPCWAEKLKECIRDYPNHFHLYIVNNKQFQDVASMCVIDAGTRNNVVEFMVSVENVLEDTAVRIASTSVFIHGQHDLADAMKKSIVANKRSSITKKCETEADIDQFLN